MHRSWKLRARSRFRPASPLFLLTPLCPPVVPGNMMRHHHPLRLVYKGNGFAEGHSAAQCWDFIWQRGQSAKWSVKGMACTRNRELLAWRGSPWGTGKEAGRQHRPAPGAPSPQAAPWESRVPATARNPHYRVLRCSVKRHALTSRPPLN